MRKIIFKAKRIDNGKWVKGYYYRECGNTYIIEDRQDESELNRNTSHLVDPTTVCQFTGFKDRLGQNIYEGDRIQTEAGSTFEVGFDEGTFAARYINSDVYAFKVRSLAPYSIVTGNKHDRK